MHGRQRVGRALVDSRAAGRGDLFFAVRFKGGDGHEYVQDALTRGATAVVDRDGFAGENVIRVADSIAALCRLAAWWRTRLRARVIAITGSCGKTTTKEMLRAVCASAGPTVAAEKSFNNILGVPLTILSADVNTRFLVLEMGTNRPGEIRELAKIARPDIGVVLNARTTHLAELKSVGAVAAEKMSLGLGLASGGRLLVDRNERRLVAAAGRGRRTLFYDSSDAGAITVRPTATEFTYKGLRVRIPLGGRHYVPNAVAALETAALAGIPLAVAAAQIRMTRPAEHRMRVTKGLRGLIVIDDCYNANPCSMRAAVDFICECYPEKRKSAVLGDMGELGARSARLHGSVGKYVGKSDIDDVYLFGPKMRAAKEFFRGVSGRVRAYTDQATLVADLARRADDRGAVLVKGSRSQRLETTVAALLKEKG